MTGFDAGILGTLRATPTVRIETSGGAGRPVHEAVIWIVVDESDRVLVRSVRGERGRWYRELVAHPVGAVHVGGTRVPVRAGAARDADRVAACTRALSSKYASSRGSLASMVRNEVLESTLELRPG